MALESIKLSAEAAPEMLGIETGTFGSQWERLSAEVFDVDLMHDMAMDFLTETLGDDLLVHAAGFYASDLGLRLVAVENAAHMDEASEQRQAAGVALVAEMVRESAPRLALLRRMNAAVDVNDTNVKAVQEIQYRFLVAASAAGVLDLRIDPEELRAILRRDEARLRNAMRESGLANAAYTYRDLPDADLEAYAEALEHPKMQEVYMLMNVVQYEITANRFEVLARRMSALQPEEEL